MLVLKPPSGCDLENTCQHRFPACGDGTFDLSLGRCLDGASLQTHWAAPRSGGWSSQHELRRQLMLKAPGPSSLRCLLDEFPGMAWMHGRGGNVPGSTCDSTSRDRLGPQCSQPATAGHHPVVILSDQHSSSSNGPIASVYRMSVPIIDIFGMNVRHLCVAHIRGQFGIGSASRWDLPSNTITTSECQHIPS